MASQAGSHIPVTVNSTFVQLRLRFDLAVSNIYINILLGPQLEGSQIDMGSILCTTFPVNDCM